MTVTNVESDNVTREGGLKLQMSASRKQMSAIQETPPTRGIIPPKPSRSPREFPLESNGETGTKRTPLDEEDTVGRSGLGKAGGGMEKETGWMGRKYKGDEVGSDKTGVE